MGKIVDPNYEERPPVPPGEFEAQVVDYQEKTSKAGNPYLNWKFELIHADKNIGGRNVFASTSYSGAGARFLKKLYQAAVDPSYEKGPIDADDVIGKRLRLVIEKGQGTWPDVLDFKPTAGGSAGEPAEREPGDDWDDVP